MFETKPYKQRNTEKTFIWIYNKIIYKAVIHVEEGILIIYFEHKGIDEILFRRTGLSLMDIRKIEDNIIKFGIRKYFSNSSFLM
jgi:hypothetical protein